MRRVADPARIAEILGLYADPPGYRERPAPDDPTGRYNAWFDGGAIRRDTGSTLYVFDDGAKLHTGPFVRLELRIELPGGITVTIRQED